jgi:hypothetical protein
VSPGHRPSVPGVSRGSTAERSFEEIRPAC